MPVSRNRRHQRKRSGVSGGFHYTGLNQSKRNRRGQKYKRIVLKLILGTLLLLVVLMKILSISKGNSRFKRQLELEDARRAKREQGQDSR